MKKMLETKKELESTNKSKTESGVVFYALTRLEQRRLLLGLG